MHVHIINIERKSLSERVQIRALQGKIDLINGFQKILPLFCTGFIYSSMKEPRKCSLIYGTVTLVLRDFLPTIAGI